MKRILTALAALAFAGVAHADPIPISSNVLVQTTIVDSCRLTTAATLDLGDYDPLVAGDLTGTQQVDVLCTAGTYSVSLSGFSGFLNNAGSQLAYTLEPSVGGGVWPVTINAPSGGDATSNVQSFDLVATVTAGQFQPVGIYQETVTLTLDL